MRLPATLIVRIMIVAIVAACATFAPHLTTRWRTHDPLDLGDRADGAFALPAGPRIAGRARVLDGDSLELNGEAIRLSGIDAPESRQRCRDGAGRTYACGRVATRALAAAVAGRSIDCTRLERDRYRRQVALCAVAGRDLGEAMVWAGFAVDFPAFSHGRYDAAERAAREARRGLWAGTFQRPSDWRRGR